MRRSLSARAGALLLPTLLAAPASAFSDFGKGRPITERDLAGKKICWDNGRWTSYGKDGNAVNSREDKFEWSVPTPGVVETGDRRTQTEILADGRVHTYRYMLRSQNHDRDGWGTFCK
jgi:hypothetical protein